MTELELQNFDEAVLGKLNLSAEARMAFRKLLGSRVVEDGGKRKSEERILPSSSFPSFGYAHYWPAV